MEVQVITPGWVLQANQRWLLVHLQRYDSLWLHTCHFANYAQRGTQARSKKTLQPGIEPESLRWWGSDFLSTLSGASGCICNCIGASIPQCM